MCNQKQSRSSPVVSEKSLTVEVHGVSMLLNGSDKIVLPEGRKARIGTDGRSVIPPHIAFIAFRPGDYDRGTLKPAITFSYDLEGVNEVMEFDAFLLDQHTISFEGVVKNFPSVDDSTIPRMTDLVGSLELCPSVIEGSSRHVVGTLDLVGARSVAGKDHGTHTHAIAFGNDVRNWAEKISVTYEASNEPPQVRLRRNKSHPLAGEDDVFIPLMGKGPWTVMVANIPPEEVMDLNETEIGQNVPLTHLELLFDLYHGPTPVIGNGREVLQVPRCRNHEVPQMAGHAGHVHAGGVGRPTAVGARIAGSGAHCGPPVSSGG